ncbi:MAG: hypothetical protein KJI71_03880 [Patescibacteria group bacterium]|nr:hypothetical protein [Patescibacteria group bacterium]
MWKKLEVEKSKFLLWVPVGLISLEAYFAGLSGYFFARFSAGKLNSLIIDLGRYKFHIHHWLMGSVALALTVLYNLSPLMNFLFFGFIGGIIFQGISSYSDWHRVLIRKE